MTAVRVVSNDSRYGQDVTIRQFQLSADEPPTLGGDDLGPTPVEWTLTGLGTCKAITLKMYAERKGWHLEQVAVDLAYESHDGDAIITAHLTLTGNLTPEQRERLREISDRCPVHKLLTNPVQIQTQLVPGGISLDTDPPTLREATPRLHPPAPSPKTERRGASSLKSLSQCWERDLG